MRRHWVLLLILSLGLFFRIYHLDRDSIWADEGFSIKCARLDVYECVMKAASDVHPPLYFIILHYWMNLFGDSAFSARFLSVLFGFLAIFMMYKVGKVIFDRDTGLLGSFLLAFSTFHIYYSQTVRMYSLMSFLGLASMFFFLKLLNENNRFARGGYILSSVFLLYVHYYGIFIIIAQNIYFLLQFIAARKPQSRELCLKDWVETELIVLVLFSPWAFVPMRRMLVFAETDSSWIIMPSKFPIVRTFFVYTGFVKTLLVIYLSLSVFSMLKYRGDSGVFLKRIKSLPWGIDLHQMDKVLFLCIWLLVPVFLPLLFSLFFFPVYLPRYTIGSFLAFFLLAAKGISNVKDRFLKTVIIVLITFFSLLSMETFYSTIHDQQWREVVQHIDSKSRPGDLLLFNSSYGQKNGFDHYSQKAGFTKNKFLEKTLEAVNDEMLPAIQGYDRIWVILFGPKENRGLIKSLLNRSYHEKEYQKYVGGPGGIEIYLFEK